MKIHLWGAVSLLALTWPSMASAQSAAPAPAPSPDSSAPQADSAGDAPASGDIVIKGIRRSLEDATRLKRERIGISDAISAEDIGKFPDQNLAESLQRVTGVQITRNKGEGVGVSLRGLGPGFAQTQFNGRQIATPGGGRNFTFTSLTSDFVSAAEVIKSPTADMIEGGLSGTVNVRMARPLDAGRNVLAITAEGIYEQNTRKFTPHLSLFVNHVFNDTVGVNFGVNFEKRGVLQGGFLGYGAENGIEASRSPRLDYNLDGDFNDQFRFIHATTLVAENGTFDRRTLVGGIQIKPSKTLNLYADAFYSEFRDFEVYNEHQVRFTNIQGANAGVVSSTNNGTYLTSLDANGVDHRADMRPIRGQSNVFSGAAGVIWSSDPLTLSAEFTYSNARRARINYGFSDISRASASYDARAGFGEVPIVAFNRGYNPLDPSTFNLLSIGGSYDALNADRNYDGRLDARYAFEGDGVSGAIKLGWMFSDRRSDFTPRTFNLSGQTLATALGQPYNSSVEGGSTAAARLLSEVDFSRFVVPVLGRYLSPDLAKLYAILPESRILELAPPVVQRANQFSISEKNLAGYIMFDIKSLDDKFALNVGLRYVRTKQSSDGFAPDLTSLLVLRGGIITQVTRSTEVSIKNSYDEWLPSLNVSYEITPNFKARFALARTLTRPDLNLLSPALTVNANTRAISASNPNLKPYTANQADLSLEYYFGRSGLLSAAVFYKDVNNLIVRTSTPVTYTVTLEEGGTAQQDFLLAQPRNGFRTKIKGFEVGAQVPFTFLPGPFDGLGVLANLTYLDLGKVVVTQGQPAIPIAGASKWSYNLGGYYEKGGFGIRASYNYRSRYAVDPLSTFGDGDYQRGFGQLDVSASYDVNKQISLTADVTNLTNASLYNETQIGVLRAIQNFGRRFTGSVRVRF